jgi:hypothetical protein
MALMERIRRLGKMNLAEFVHRAGQQARIGQERWNFVSNGTAAVPPWKAWDAERVGDRQLARALAEGRSAKIACLLPEYFAARAAPRFFFDREERRRIAQFYPRFFPGRADEIRAEADALCAHRFKIFAYPEVEAGRQIPWHRDMVHGIQSGDGHWSGISYLDFSQAGDSKIVWEPNRHQQCFTLGQAWILTGDEHYAEECLAQIDDWLRANPYPRGINWASSLEAAFRAWSWLWALHLLAGSKALSGARLGALTAGLAGHAEYIAANLSTYFSPNTHLLGEGFALYAIGLLLPELRGAESWHKAGLAILLREMECQVRGDGAHIEQSSCYHRYAMEFFLCAALLAERNGGNLPASYLNHLDRMFEFSMGTAWPSGGQPMTGDADGGQLLRLAPRRPNDHRPLLGIAAAWRGRGDFAAAAGRLPEEALWLLGPTAAEHFAGIQPEDACGTSSVFRASGAVAQRSGTGARARYLFFDAGPQGMGSCAHGHADALQILCAADGVEWLVDPGTFVYTSSREWRDYLRGTRAHSTAALDGQDQAGPTEPFKWRAIPEVRLETTWLLRGLDAATASHSGYARIPGGGAHRRAVVFVKPDYWLLADTLEGHGPHTLEFFFHFAPGIALSIVEGAVMATKGAERFLLKPEAPGATLRVIEGSESPIQGWFSEDYGNRAAAPVVVGEMKTTLPARALWLLWPSPTGELRLKSADGPGARGVQATIEMQGWTDHISLRASEDAADARGLSTDADLAFLRHDTSERLLRFAFAGGCCADFGGQPLLRAESWLDTLEATPAGDTLGVQMRPLRRVRLRWPGAARVTVNNHPVEGARRGDWIEIPGDM